MFAVDWPQAMMEIWLFISTVVQIDFIRFPVSYVLLTNASMYVCMHSYMYACVYACIQAFMSADISDSFDYVV